MCEFTLVILNFYTQKQTPENCRVTNSDTYCLNKTAHISLNNVKHYKKYDYNKMNINSETHASGTINMSWQDTD